MKTKQSRALLDVWDMKEAVCEETKHLKGAAYFSFMRAEASQLFPTIRQRVLTRHGTAAGQYPERASSACVAENGHEYGEAGKTTTPSTKKKK
jgi:hypothetical protein